MTFIEAAEAVLVQRGAKMKAKEITEEALSQGLIQTRGKTPLATMISELNHQYDLALGRKERPRVLKDRQARRLVYWYVAESTRTDVTSRPKATDHT